MNQASTGDFSKKNIRVALDKVLSCDDFVRSKRIKQLLAYIVEKSISGKANELKAYTIGLDVYDRSPDFDPEKDAIVRVEMGRLRSKLEHYYLTTGKDETLRIIIPKGTYCPSFIDQRKSLSEQLENLTLGKMLQVHNLWKLLAIATMIPSIL